LTDSEGASFSSQCSYVQIDGEEKASLGFLVLDKETSNQQTHRAHHANYETDLSPYPYRGTCKETYNWHQLSMDFGTDWALQLPALFADKAREDQQKMESKSAMRVTKSCSQRSKARAKKILISRPYSTSQSAPPVSRAHKGMKRLVSQDRTPSYVLRIRYWRKINLEVADRRSRCQPRKKCPNRWRPHLLPRMRQFLKKASNGHQ